MAKSYKKLQEEFDRDKWLKSEEYGADLSGAMECCWVCDHRYDMNCTATREEIVAKSLCARATKKREKELKGAKK